MPLFTGTWTAKVEQDFEIEAADENELRDLLSNEMQPANVVELIDFEVVSCFKETDGDDEWVDL